MAKPFPGVSGNGAAPAPQPASRTASTSSPRASDDGPLGNAAMRHWVAGLATHAAQLALLANPTVNAYKRIEDYSFAPTRVSWGLDNRNVAVRCIPQVGRRLARRVPRRRGRRQPLPAGGRRAGGGHGRDRARAGAAAEPPSTTPTPTSACALLPRSLGAAIEAWEATTFAARDVRRALRRRLRGPRPLRPVAVRGRHHRLGNAALPGVRIASWQRAHSND